MFQWHEPISIPKEVRDFCCRLRENDPTLTGKELKGKRIGDEGAKAVANALTVNTSLLAIYLYGNNITHVGAKAIAVALKANVTLMGLDLYGNQIGDEGAKAIADALEINSTLQGLDLSWNRIGVKGAKAIAKSLGFHTSLQKLYLSDNEIGVEGANAIAIVLCTKKRSTLHDVFVDEFCDDSTAKAFMHAIAEQKFPSLKVVGGLVKLSHYLPELQVPHEFANNDNEEILSFLRERWETGEERLSVVKVVVTGPGGVGKTCLVTRLVENMFPENTQMTNGVDVVRYVDKNGVEYVCYDFGGQPVYATTHQLFLRTRAVFMAVWEPRSETFDFEHQAFHQYARDMLDASPEAQIIFVTAKSDQGCMRLTADQLQKLETMYQGHFLGYHHISAQTNSGIEDLKQEITNAATSVLQGLGGEHGLKGMKVPKTWIHLKEKLGILRDSQHEFFLSSTEWDSHVRSVNVVEDDRAQRVLRLFHEMGEVHSLPTGQIVIDPARLTEVLSRVVTKDQRYVDNTRGGYLRHKELSQVWGDWDEQLHKGFLELLHECEIGYRIRDDDGTDYEATLIPAMVHRDGETLAQHVDRLALINIELKKGPNLKVEIATRSSRFGPKLLAKLRGVTIIGGWWKSGCIVVDTGDTKDLRAFGTVSWAVEEGVMVVTIMTYGAGRLLTLKALNALGSCLEEFPGVHVEGFDMHCGFSGCRGGWNQNNILSCEADTVSCSKCGRRREVVDVKGWIITMSKEPSGSVITISAEQDLLDEKAAAQASLAYLKRMLNDDSDASAEMLCYLLLTHQKDLLAHGCTGSTHGRLQLNALWLIYSLEDGSLMAYPFCPHAEPESIIVHDELGIAGDEADRQTVNFKQRELDEIARLLLSNTKLDIVPPDDDVRFTGILWHDARSKFVSNVKKTSRKHFKKVDIPEIGQVWVHKSDEMYFRDNVQVNLIKKLKNEVEESVRAHVDSEKQDFLQATDSSKVFRDHGLAELSASLKSTHLEEVGQLEENAFTWVVESFGDWSRRQRIKTVLDEMAIDSAMANSVKVGLRTKMSDCFEDFKDFHSFYPEVIVSYSTGNRKGRDVDCAGPGLLVVVGVISLLLKEGCPCYSDILTPAGVNWEEYMLRLKKARVMVVLMSKTFFRSVHCLREVAAAIENGVDLIPVRLEEASLGGIDIARDKEYMWPLEELARYAKHQPNTMRVLEELRVQREKAVEKLATIGSLPAHGTILSEQTAVDELVNRVKDFVPCTG